MDKWVIHEVKGNSGPRVHVIGHVAQQEDGTVVIDMEEADLAPPVTNDHEDCVQKLQQLGEPVDTVHRPQYVRVSLLEHWLAPEDAIQEAKERIDADQTAGKVVENKNLEKTSNKYKVEYYYV